MARSKFQHNKRQKEMARKQKKEDKKQKRADKNTIEPGDDQLQSPVGEEDGLQVLNKEPIIV